VTQCCENALLMNVVTFFQNLQKEFTPKQAVRRKFASDLRWHDAVEQLSLRKTIWNKIPQLEWQVLDKRKSAWPFAHHLGSSFPTKRFSSGFFKSNTCEESWIKRSKLYPSVLSKGKSMILELDQRFGTAIYIGRYDDVANVSYRQNSADTYRQYLLIQVLRCCSPWNVRKPKLQVGVFKTKFYKFGLF